MEMGVDEFVEAGMASERAGAQAVAEGGAKPTRDQLDDLVAEITDRGSLAASWPDIAMI